MSLGFGATLVPTYFSAIKLAFLHDIAPLPMIANLPLRYVFTYTGDNKAKAGFFDPTVLVMETGFTVTGLLAMILNLIIQEEEDKEVSESLICH